MKIEVFTNDNCKGVCLKNIVANSLIWNSHTIVLKQKTSNGEFKKIKVYPCCSGITYFTNLSIFETTTINNKRGYLITGGDYGLRVPRLRKSFPVIWLDYAERIVLPKKVIKFFENNSFNEIVPINENYNNVFIEREKLELVTA